MTAVHENRTRVTPVPPRYEEFDDLDAATDAFLSEFDDTEEEPRFEDYGDELTADWNTVDAVAMELGISIPDAEISDDELDSSEGDSDEADSLTSAEVLKKEGSPLADVYGTAVWEAVDRELPPWNTGPDGDWRPQALCAQTDPEAFFPEKGGSTRAAKSICMQCPVRRECLEYALINNERYGIWGGYSERERRVIGRSREAYRSGKTEDSGELDASTDRQVS